MDRYKELIEEQYKEAMKNLNMLSPAPIIDNRLQYYAGCMKALLELRRIALGEPIIKCTIKEPINEA